MMKAGTLVYVSHPFTGDELANKEKAREAARAVMRISRSDLWYPDAVVVNPLDALTYMDGMPYEVPMHAALALLDKYDGKEV